MFWTFINVFSFQCYDFIIFLSLLAISGFTFLQFSAYLVTLSYIVRVCFSRKVARVSPLHFLFFDNKTRGIPDLRSGSDGFGMGRGDRAGPPFQTQTYNVYHFEGKRMNILT